MHFHHLLFIIQAYFLNDRVKYLRIHITYMYTSSIPGQLDLYFKINNTFSLEHVSIQCRKIKKYFKQPVKCILNESNQFSFIVTRCPLINTIIIKQDLQPAQETLYCEILAEKINPFLKQIFTSMWMSFESNMKFEKMTFSLLFRDQASFFGSSII